MSLMRTRIIAEIGTSHGGDLGTARELIHAAREAGADTAKFQYVIADEILHPATGSVELPGGPVDLYQRFRTLEQPPGFYEQLVAECESAGIAFLCSVFGIESARAVRELGVTEFKVASPELNHLPLLAELAGTQSRVILSAGVAPLAEIETAVDLFRNPPAAGIEAVELLHCVTAYPAPETDYNLRLLPALATLLGCRVGVSDHSLDPLAVPLVATALGATAIEKHITLSRTGDGLDDPIAIDPEEFAAMVVAVRTLGEVAPSERLEMARRRLGGQRVESVLGDGVKRLAASERANYGRTNRSIHARYQIPAGSALTSENVAILRTEHNLSQGLHPRHWSEILGCLTSEPLAAGEGVLWRHVTTRKPV